MVNLDVILNSEMVQEKLSLSDPWYQMVLKMLQSISYNFDNQVMIEVGCGLGGFIVNAAKKGAIIVGFDISIDAIRIVNNLSKILKLQDNLNLVVGDAQFLPFREQVSNIVVCAETLEHIPDYEKAFKELVYVTRKSGYLCVTIPNYMGTAFFENVFLLLMGQPEYVKKRVYVEKEHVFHYFKLLKLLHQENIEVISIQSIDILHLPPRIRKILRNSNRLRLISERLEDIFLNQTSPLRLIGANIGVLAKKQ